MERAEGARAGADADDDKAAREAATATAKEDDMTTTRTAYDADGRASEDARSRVKQEFARAVDEAVAKRAGVKIEILRHVTEEALSNGGYDTLRDCAVWLGRIVRKR